MGRLLRVSIARKLYAIFALLATVTVVLVAVAMARHAELTGEFDWLLSLTGGIAILICALGALVLRQSVLYPLAEMTWLAEQVADGHVVAIPSATRRDEIGALWRLIGVFQDTMRRNQELNKTVLQDAELRGARQEHVSAEVAAFTNSIERNIAELGAISDRVLESATHLAEAAERAARRTEGATAASAEASAMYATSPRRPTSWRLL